MTKILIYNKESNELIQQTRTNLEAYRFRYNILSKEGIDTYCKKEIKKKTNNQLLDKQCEKLWREILLHDARHKCEKCKNNRYLNCHHIITRSIKALRWDILNGIVLCPGCHTLSHKFSAHKTPSDFKIWINKYNHEGFYENLQLKANSIHKLDLLITLENLKSQATMRYI